MTARDKRIFFLGMHVVLTKTELPRLRSLGYEVFNPPYLSGVYDQSANLNWDAGQPTTLPREAFELLSRTNFFYEPIPPAAAEILNAYFGTVFVTINPDWLYELSKVYRGRIIYRTYGQTWSISEALKDRGLLRRLHEREDFHVLPFAEECCEDEHDLVRERMRFVPYALTEDVFPHRDTWWPDYGRGQVMVPIPNIRNAYYKNQYNHIKTHFPGDHLRIYGVQPEPTDDPRVVGTLPRATQLDHYRRLTGQFYPYHDENVCYLPPIEFMTIGGPVIYVQNSLLHKYFGHWSPGLATSMGEQRRKIEWVRRGDKAFVSEVIASQAPVRRRYSPEHVWPIFDRTIRECVEGRAVVAPPSLLIDTEAGKRPADVAREQTNELIRVGGGASAAEKPRRRVYVIFHFPGGIVGFRKGKYFSTEGIPRVIQKLVSATLEQTDLEVVVTCLADHVLYVHGFFDAARAGGRVKVMVIDHERLKEALPPLYGRMRTAVQLYVRSTRLKVVTLKLRTLADADRTRMRMMSWPETGVLNKAKKGGTALGLQTALSAARVGYRVTRATYRVMRKAFLSTESAGKKLVRRIEAVVERAAEKTRSWPLPWFMRRHEVKAWLAKVRSRSAIARMVSAINADASAAFVLIPHYYLFPETVKLTPKKMIYLPDYMPHFFPGVSFDANRDAANAAVGRSICQGCHTVLTASEFSAGYLPESALAVEKSKLAVVPIPLLASSRKELKDAEEEHLRNRFEGSRYVFYPTANRPNKQIPFLLEVMGELVTRYPDLRLVLTCNLADYKPAVEALERVEKKLDRAREGQRREAEVMGWKVVGFESAAPAARERVFARKRAWGSGGDSGGSSGSGGSTGTAVMAAGVSGSGSPANGHASGNGLGFGGRNGSGKNGAYVNGHGGNSHAGSAGGRLGADEGTEGLMRGDEVVEIPRLADRLVFMPGISDGSLQWLYGHAAAICFSSTMEGNFPPQVFEALAYGTPVVATRLPLITEILGEQSDELILCPPLDLQAFVSGMVTVMEDPDWVRERQQGVLRRLMEHANDARFSKAVGEMLRARGLV